MELLHQLFSEQAEKTPDIIAIDDGKRQYTYRELDENIKVGDTVAIYMERNLYYIICYIAILKAGAAYLPIEINNPVENIKQILRTGECKNVLSNSKFLSQINQIESENQAQVLILDKQSEWEFSQNYLLDTSLTAHQKLDDKAFVVLSSGSTGAPKGISAPHRASVHGYLERNEFNSYKVGDRVGCNIFFVWEILRPLLQGGTVIPIPENIIFEPEEILNFIEKHKLSEVLFTPSLLETIINCVDKETFLKKTQSMKTFYLNGEPVKVQLKKQLLQMIPNKNIINTYSISECHDISNEHLQNSKEYESGFISCGVPIDKVKLLILDLNTGEKIENNQEGEVLIGGPGVAIGYLNGPPSLNENGFPIIDGIKYFRTGDIGVKHQDGRLEIKGRCNTKIKMRGYTVFLGMVEKALITTLNLQASIVIYDQKREKMTAYLVKKKGEVNDFSINKKTGLSQEIRKKLKVILPEYAIPHYFIEIDDIPINELSGKANKKLLPFHTYLNSKEQYQQEEKQDQSINQYHSDSISFQQKYSILQQIWRQILKTDDNIDDNSDFFDLGGHSLLAMQTVSYYEQVFAKKMQVKVLYENPKFIDFVQATLKIFNNKHINSSALRETNSPFFIQELHGDASIVDNLKFEYNNDNKQNDILITGTTGFLGAFLLKEILCQKQYNFEKVYCLVRGTSQENASERLFKNLDFYGLKSQLQEKNLLQKIVPVQGDLTQDNLGMENNQLFQKLTNEVDFVFHCAAGVNFVKPYSILKPATVDATANVLKFCSSNYYSNCTNAKKLIYVSTNGILPPKYERKFLEDKNIDDYLPYLVNDGYGQTKWVAEKMVWNCENNGRLKAMAYRFGNLGHETATGVKNPQDFQSQLLEACHLIGAAPDCQDWKFEASPVDFVAQCMSQLSFQQGRNCFGKVYHIIENQPVFSSEVFNLIRDKKLINEIVTFEQWKTKISNALQEYENKKDQYPNEYSALLSTNESLDDLQKYLTDSNQYDRSQVQNDLSFIGIKYPRVQASYYEKILM